ncbi:MAG: O-antigen ligase family protein [Candidatus Omnitrophica bacterium]|nr:O-antigen ligase family protein [Candidatus Omnitrophota bacterium]
MLLLIFGATLAEKNKKQIVNIVVYSGIIIALLAIYQYFFGFRHVSEYLTRHNITSDFTLDYIQRRRVFFPFVTPNILAGYLAMTIPLALLNRYKTFALLPLFLALFLTKSLGGLLSAFLALSAYFYLKGKIEKRGIILLTSLLLIIGIVFGLRWITGKQHIHPIFSATMRLGYWQDTLKIIGSYPLTGVGLGNFNLPQARYAHNSYLQLWAETGVLGITSFLWLIFVIFKGAILRLKNSSEIKQNAALLAACSAFLAHNFIDFSFFLPEVSLIWWMLYGTCLATKERKE